VVETWVTPKPRHAIFEVERILDTFWIHFLQNFACITANLGLR
jgi:hypothetical protein